MKLYNDPDHKNKWIAYSYLAVCPEDFSKGIETVENLN